MKKHYDKRERLLREMIRYAEERGMFRYAEEPMCDRRLFKRSEMMKRLCFSEDDFNNAVNQLGPKCITQARQEHGDIMYEIHLADCIESRDQFDDRKTHKARHRVLLLWTLFVALLAAFLSVIYKY